ncbi:bcl-2-like protein 12 isoform X2 [Gopherus evgoodei]|nr:bcl-2-like protein 12 isoform X2 [Gopherus evgoodei]
MAAPPEQRGRLQEETRLVLEAFLRGALGQRPPLGHVGGSYHDPHCYAHRRPVELRGAPAPGGAWTPLHEEISRVEERKHGFKTSMKRLLLRRISPRRDPPGAEPRKGPKEGGEGRPKHGRGFSFRGVLRRKGPPREETEPPPPLSAPPNSLPVTPCYCSDTLTAQPDPPPLGRVAEDPEFYARVARKLDRLVKRQRSGPGTPSGVLSPGVMAGPLSPELGPGPPAPPEPASETHKEQVIRRLVALLEEQAGVINEEIEADPLLRSSLSRLSYRSFSRLAEAYTARADPGSPSPQLTRLALTMELTRKVAGINSHPVQTLMGYSLQYMDMFVPWLQQQGGWGLISLPTPEGEHRGTGRDVRAPGLAAPGPEGARRGCHKTGLSPFPPQNPPCGEDSERSCGGRGRGALGRGYLSRGKGRKLSQPSPNSQGEWGSLEKSAPQNLWA